MIELTEQQAEALERPGAVPPVVVNPKTRETFVLLSADEYKRLTADGYVFPVYGPSGFGDSFAAPRAEVALEEGEHRGDIAVGEFCQEVGLGAKPTREAKWKRASGPRRCVPSAASRTQSSSTA